MVVGVAVLISRDTLDIYLIPLISYLPLIAHAVDPPLTIDPTVDLPFPTPRREAELLADKQKARTEFLKKLEQEQQRNAREQAKVQVILYCLWCVVY